MMEIRFQFSYKKKIKKINKPVIADGPIPKKLQIYIVFY